MVLAGLGTVLSIKLGQEVSTSIGGDQGMKLGKKFINKLTKKFLKREIFKKNVSEMSAEELEGLFSNLLDDIGKEYLNTISESIDEQSVQLGGIENSIVSIQDDIQSILTGQRDLSTYFMKELSEKAWQPENISNLFAEISESLFSMNEETNTKLLNIFSEKLETFTPRLDAIKKDTEQILHLLQDGQKLSQQDLDFLKDSIRSQLEGDLSSEALFRLSAKHIGWVTRSEQFRSRGDVSFDQTRYVSRSNFANNFESFMQSEQQLFLILGEAGMGKTWFMASLALLYVKKGYPVFFIRLREGFENTLESIFGMRASVFERVLEKKDLTIDPPLLLFFDGYDEIRYFRQKEDFINGLLLTINNRTKKTKIVVSSRFYDWFTNRETARGKAVHLQRMLWPPSAKYSVYLQQFTDEEFEAAVSRYGVADQYSEWDPRIQELAHHPIWLRFIIDGFQSSPVSISDPRLYSMYFERMGLDDSDLPVLVKVAERYYGTENRRVSIAPLYRYRDRIDGLISAYVLRLYPETNEVDFTVPEFAGYSLAKLQFSSLLDLREATRISDRTATEQSIHELDWLILNTGEDVKTLFWGFLKVFADRKSLDLEQLIPTDTGDLKALPQAHKENISQEELFKAIRIYQHNKEVYLQDLAVHLNRSVADVSVAVNQFISNGKLGAKIDRKGTADPADDQLMLERGWDVEARQERISELKKSFTKDSGIEERILAIKELLQLGDKTENWQEQKNRLEVEKQERLEKTFREALQKSDIRGATEVINELLRLESISDHDRATYEKKRARVDKFTTLEKTYASLSESRDYEKKFNLVNEIIKLGIMKERWGKELGKITDFIKILEHNGTQIIRHDHLVLVELENAVGESIPHGHISPYLPFGFIANENRVIAIGLSGKGLNSLPESIGGLSKLKGLYLDSNQLSILPESIGELSRLEVLQLSFNELRGLPESIGELSNLQRLYLDSNKLSSLPESITQLQLDFLNMWENPDLRLNDPQKAWMKSLEERGAKIYR